MFYLYFLSTESTDGIQNKFIESISSNYFVIILIVVIALLFFFINLRFYKNVIHLLSSTKKTVYYYKSQERKQLIEKKDEISESQKVKQEDFSGRNEEVEKQQQIIDELNIEKSKLDSENEELLKKLREKDNLLTEKNKDILEKVKYGEVAKKELETISELWSFIKSCRNKVKNKVGDYKTILNDLGFYESYINILNGSYDADVIVPVTTLFDDNDEKFLLKHSNFSIILPWDKIDYDVNKKHLRGIIDFITSLRGRKTQQVPSAYIKKTTTQEFVLDDTVFTDKRLGIKLTDVVQSLLVCVKILEQGIRQLPLLRYSFIERVKPYHVWDDSIPLVWIKKIFEDIDCNNEEQVLFFKEEIKVYYDNQLDRLEKMIAEAPGVIKKVKKLYFSYIDNTFIKSLNSTIFIHNHFKNNIMISVNNEKDTEVLRLWEEFFIQFENILRNFMKDRLDIYQIKTVRGDVLNFDIHNPYEEAREEKGMIKDKIIEVINPGYECIKDDKTFIIRMTDVVVSK